MKKRILSAILGLAMVATMLVTPIAALSNLDLTADTFSASPALAGSGSVRLYRQSCKWKKKGVSGCGYTLLRLYTVSDRPSETLCDRLEDTEVCPSGSRTFPCCGKQRSGIF